MVPPQHRRQRLQRHFSPSSRTCTPPEANAVSLKHSPSPQRLPLGGLPKTQASPPNPSVQRDVEFRVWGHGVWSPVQLTVPCLVRRGAGFRAELVGPGIQPCLCPGCFRKVQAICSWQTKKTCLSSLHNNREQCKESRPLNTPWATALPDQPHPMRQGPLENQRVCIVDISRCLAKASAALSLENTSFA